MAQFHYVVYYDTAKEQWDIDWGTTEARFPEGEVWDYAGSKDWSDVPENEHHWYVSAGQELLAAANDWDPYENMYDHTDDTERSQLAGGQGSFM